MSPSLKSKPPKKLKNQESKKVPKKKNNSIFYLVLSEINLLLLIPFGLFSQFAWDIKYVPVDSIDRRLLHKPVGIDFGSSRYISKLNSLVHHSLDIPDTVSIKIYDKDLLFVEKRKIHFDMGVFSEQKIESIDNLYSYKLMFYSVFIQEIKNDSLLFLIPMIFFSENKSKRIKAKAKKEVIVKKMECFWIWIEKKQIDGIFFSNEKTTY